MYTEILHNFKKTLTKKDNQPDDFAENAIRNLAKVFEITEEDVLMLTKIAAFFHDSAREGDGKDYWDHRSAENCYEFLVSKGIKEDIARFFANAARYKSDANSFNEYCKAAFPGNSDLSSFHYIRQLIAYADTLDIMRCVDFFEGYYIYNFLGKSKQIKDIPLENIEKVNKLMLAIREGINAQGDLPVDGCQIKINKDPKEYLKDIERLSITPEEKLDMEFNPDPYQCMRDKLAKQAYLSKLLNPKLTTKKKPIFTANPGFFRELDFEKLINTPDKADKLEFVKIKEKDSDDYVGSIIYKDKEEPKNEADDSTLIDIFSDKLECPLQATDETKLAQAEAIVKIVKASLDQQVDKSVPVTITANEAFTLEHLKLILNNLKQNKIVVKFKCTQNSSNEIKELVNSYNTQYKKKLGLL